MSEVDVVGFPGSRRANRASALLVSAVLLSGLSMLPAQAQQQPRSTVLRAGMVTDIDHLNPFTATRAASTQLGRLMYEFLTLPSAENAQPTGGLAERWQPSPDKLTWTFTIREGMTWSDGEPITARDPAYTYNRMLQDPKARTANGQYVANFESVTAPDERTLVIKTKSPQSSMLALDVPIVPEHIWKDIPDLDDPKTDEVATVGVSSGPFVITDYRQNEFVKFRANDRYWRGRPKIDELQFLSFKNSDAAVNALKNDEVDLVNRLTPTQFESLQGVEGITTNKAQGRRYNELLMNPGAATNDNQPIGDGHPALKDVRVRKAIATAMNPQAIVDRVASGYAEVGGGLVPPTFRDYHWEPSQAQRYTFDLGSANEQLDRAGYPRGPEGVRVGPDGRKLEFRFTGHADRDLDQRALEYVTGWLREIGIAVQPNLVSEDEVDEKTSAGYYDLAMSGWGTSPDPDYVLSLHTCDSRPNAGGSGGTTASFFCDPEFESLYTQQLGEFDPAKRAQIVKQAQARFYDRAPSLVIDYDNALEAYRSDNFGDFAKQPQPTGPIMEQNGYWGYYSATPTEGADQGGSGNTGMWVGIGAVVAVVLVGGGVFYSRRTRSVEDRE